MADSQIILSPRGTSGGRGLAFTGGLQELSSRFVRDGTTRVTHGGKVKAVTFDAWREFQLRADAFHEGDWATIWSKVHTIIAELQVGEPFEFALDGDEDWTVTTVGATAKNDFVIDVDSSADVTAGDRIRIEHATDPTMFGYHEVLSVATGSPDTITLVATNAIDYTFPIGSKIYHHGFEPNCVSIKPPKFQRRSAGQGLDLWDFQATFRSVLL